MNRRLLLMLGKDSSGASQANAPEFYKPYKESHLNFLYNLLFCDDIGLYKNQNNVSGEGLWSTLLAKHPDITALRTIADDETNEGRVRALAYNRLRALGDKVSAKKLFGTIVEVPLQEGLDVLAAFVDGGVRYLNHSGQVTILEGQGNPVEALAKELIVVSQPVVNQIGPWDKQRLSAPKLGNVRMTFLVSDGLYFGEGPFDALQKDQMAGPVLAKATQLLQRVFELGVR
jgi:hypothetical protein